MNTNEQILKQLGVSVIEHNTHAEFVFNKVNIVGLRGLKLEEFDFKYSISIETEDAKIFLNTQEYFNFSDCDVSIDQNTLYVSYSDFDFAELYTQNIFTVQKYNLPETAYFFILNSILNKNITIHDNNIAIVKDAKQYQIHIWEDEISQIFGVRKIPVGDTIRDIPYKNYSTENILITRSLLAIGLEVIGNVVKYYKPI